MCHHNWVTQEVVSDQQKLPTEIWSRPDRRKSGFTKEKKKFDTSGLAALRW
jgi:hypothetical protein